MIDLLKDRVRGGYRDIIFSENGDIYIDRRYWDKLGHLTGHTMFKNNLIIGECKELNGLGEVITRYYWVHDGHKDGENGDDIGYVDDMPIGVEREGFIYVEGRYYPD